MDKTVGSTTTSHIWDGTNIAADVTGSTVTKYIRGVQLISSKNDSTESFYNYNGHGDVVQLTNSSGTVTKQYSYDAFGNEIGKSDTDTNPFRYCGEYYDKENDSIYLRARYYSPVTGRFITEDPVKDDLNWYAYCGNNPLMFIDPLGLEDIVVAGGAYHIGDKNNYEYMFVDCALLQISNMENGATLLVADAGWKDKQRDAIVEAANERGIELLWFSTIYSLTNYINRGRDRRKDPITSFYVFAHGTDSGTGNYGITFGLYTDKNEQLTWYISDISMIKETSFARDSISNFYSCRTGNDFDNGNFAQEWANKTKSRTYAYRGAFRDVGRSEYGNTLGNKFERRFSTKNSKWSRWDKKRGPREKKPGEAYRLPEASYLTSFVGFVPQ